MTFFAALIYSGSDYAFPQNAKEIIVDSLDSNCYLENYVKYPGNLNISKVISNICIKNNIEDFAMD